MGQKPRTPATNTSTPPLFTPVTVPSTALGLGLRSARHRGTTQDHATRLAHAFHHACLDLVANLHHQIAVLVAQLCKIDHALALSAR
jgi:hypothetical protein